MENIKLIIQVIIAVGIFNVWILNFKKSSKYRGGNSQNMPDEFKAYGFESWFMKLIGFLKLSLATLLVLGIWIPSLISVCAFIIGLLMIGAIIVHNKINDPFIKSIPALTMLVLCSILIVI